MYTRRKFLAGSAAVVGMPYLSRSAQAQASTLQLAWIRQFAPAAIVEKEVEFAKEAGVTIELIGFNRGLDGMVALSKGDAQASDILVNFSHLCMALAQNIDLTVVSGSCGGLSEVVIAPGLLEASDIDDKNKAYAGSTPPWELVKGRKVGCARGSHQEFILRLGLRSAGMTADDIEFVDVKTNADQALALQQGAIDVALITEPTATQTRLDGYGILLTDGHVHPFTRLNSPLIVRTDFLKSNPETVQALVDAHVKAISFYHDDRAAWVTDTAKTTLYDNATLEHLMNPEGAGLDPQYWSNVSLDWTLPMESIQALSAGLYEAGFLQSDVTDKLPSHIDYTFLSKATGKSPEELGA